MKKEIDWMGRWYEIIKERGENDRPSFGKLNLITNEIDWMSFSHSEMDGVGAMISYYEKTNFVLTKYPSLRENALPTFLEKIKILYKLLFCSKKLKTAWKETNFNLEPLDPLKISFFIYSLEESKKIDEHCKKSNYSSNAYFMNVTTKILLSKLSTNSEGTWTLPVNLRPLLARNEIKSNHSSAILVNMNKDDTPSITHQKISTALKNKIHWGIWWVHQVGRIIGFKGMRYLSNKNAQKSFVLGSFSNLSTWTLPPDEIWIGGPPGSKNFPISIMLMKAAGRYSFSLKIHPFVLKNSELVDSYLHEITTTILQTVDKQS